MERRHFLRLLLGLPVVAVLPMLPSGNDRKTTVDGVEVGDGGIVVQPGAHAIITGCTFYGAKAGIMDRKEAEHFAGMEKSWPASG